MIKVLFVDDHELVRVGFKSLLEKVPGIKIVGLAGSVTDAEEMAVSKKPDVIVFDLRLGDENGFDIIEKIRKKLKLVKFVVFSAYDNGAYIAQAVQFGCVDYLLKSASQSSIVDAITYAYHDQIRAHGNLLRRVKATMAKKVQYGDEEAPLTKRELEILKQVAQGLTNIEIGRTLGISVETVKEHVQNLLRKTKCNDRTGVAVWGIRCGIVSASEAGAR